MLILGGGDGALLHELLKVFRSFYAKMFFVHIVIVIVIVIVIAIVIVIDS